MEASESENISTVVQFRTQLEQLRNTFNGIPSEERTAAILAVRSLLDELLHFCKSPRSVDQNSNSAGETFEDSAIKISSINVPLRDYDQFENVQLSNASRQACILAKQEKSLSDLNGNSIGKNCSEQLDCELSSLVLTTKTSEITACDSDCVAHIEIHEQVKGDIALALGTQCEKKITSIRENEPTQLFCDTNDQPADFMVSRNVLPEFIVALNEYTKEGNKEEKQIMSPASSRDPCPTLCIEEKFKLMGLYKTTDTNEFSSDKCKPTNDEIIREIGPREDLSDSAVESATTMLNSPSGRITRSMSRVSHTKQKLRTLSTKGNIKSKRKISQKYLTMQDCTNSITDSGLDSSLKDISNVQEMDEDIQDIGENEPLAKKRKVSVGRKNAVKSGKHSKMVKNKRSSLDATTADLLNHDSGMVSCRQCRLEFKSTYTFNKHTCKSDKRVFTCKHCDLHFNRPQKFQNHLNNHKRNNCKICGVLFLKREALNKHNKLEHPGLVESEKYYGCSLCEQKFVKKPSLYAHLKEHANLKYVCLKCGAMCDGEEQHAQHMTKHAEEANFHCDKCNENFVWKQQYEQHIAGHDKYLCTMCDTNFCTKKQMLKHQRMVHGIKIREEKKHECSICKKRFQRQTMLKMHVAMHNGESPLQCSICSKNYRTLKSLSKHMKTAAHLKACGQSDEKTLSLDKSFLCAECGAKFYRKQGLARHMQQLHSEDRPFECSFCDYTCKCKTNLKRHVELHKNERRFICELCGSSFHAHGTLKEHHAYVHSEDRQFVCQKCGKGFKGRSGLRRHIRSHSDNRPFVCYCGQSYKRMSHLKRHMMSIHSISFKSKRVQRIGSDDQGSSAYDDSNPSTHFQYVESMTDLIPIDSALQAQTITLPVTATDGLLIIDSPSRGTQEMTQSMTLELSDVVTRVDISQSESQLMQAVDQLNVTNSTRIPLLPPVGEQMTNSCMLPSIMDAVELNQSFDLGNVSNCGISVAPLLPSLNPQTIYHTVQNLDSSLTFPLQSSIPELTNPAGETLPSEFYTQSLAHYMSCSQPELI